MWYINKLNNTLRTVQEHHKVLRKKLVKYSQHFPLNMDSMAGEASYDMGTGAASHGPAPVSDGDRDRVKQIQELAHSHNRVLELEASAKRNMANAGIRSEKHLDAILRDLDKNVTDEDATKEMTDPYALAGELAASPLDNSRLGIARRCGAGSEIYKIGGYTIGDTEMAFAQTLAFCHVIGQCSKNETADRRKEHGDLLKLQQQERMANMSAASASIQKGSNKPTAAQLKNITLTAKEMKAKADKALALAATRKSELATCVNTTQTFLATTKEQKVSESDLAGLMKNLCLSQLIMPVFPHGITKYAAHTNCDRAAHVLDKVGDSPSEEDVGEFCAQVQSGPDTPPKDIADFELQPFVSDSVKLIREEQEELEQGLQTQEKKEDPLVKSYKRNYKGKARPAAIVSDEVFDEAIKGVNGKKSGSVQLVLHDLVDAKSKSDTRIQDDETLKYASDLEDEAANGPKKTILAIRQNVAKE
jgi:hypothetical protein